MRRLIVDSADPERSQVAPIFVDGQPVNLEAAALDALEWLKLLEEIYFQRPKIFREPQEGRTRLTRAIAALEATLPEAEAEERTTTRGIPIIASSQEPEPASD
jgi:hypothetical protein